jgi:hypothetical protein
MRIQPIARTSNWLLVPVTAKARIAPPAIMKSETGIPTSDAFPEAPCATPSYPSRRA